MFCKNCGNEISGNFCSNCGTKVVATVISQPFQSQPQHVSNEERVLWEGQPGGISGKIKSAANINSTKYKVTNQRIIVETGIIGKKQEEIELGRIKDYKVNQSLTEKMQNVGNVVIMSTDITTPSLKLENIENPMSVKEIIRSAVIDYRARMNIHYRENV